MAVEELAALRAQATAYIEDEAMMVATEATELACQLDDHLLLTDQVERFKQQLAARISQRWVDGL